MFKSGLNKFQVNFEKNRFFLKAHTGHIKKLIQIYQEILRQHQSQEQSFFSNK